MLLKLGGESGDIMSDITKLSEVKRFWETPCGLECSVCSVRAVYSLSAVCVVYSV